MNTKDKKEDECAPEKKECEKLDEKLKMDMEDEGGIPVNCETDND
jgi:hypothetical protein